MTQVFFQAREVVLFDKLCRLDPAKALGLAGN